MIVIPRYIRVLFLGIVSNVGICGIHQFKLGLEFVGMGLVASDDVHKLLISSETF